MNSFNLLLAGGGTAGHIEPALAVAQEWRRRHPQAAISFLGTEHGLETTLIPQAGFSLELIPKVSIARTLSPTLLRVPFQLIRSISATMKLLSGVDVAIGFGGYVSAPLYIAAKLKGIPCVIHEQNAIPGWANRVGSYLTPHVAVSYQTEKYSLRGATLTGLPLRKDVIEAFSQANGAWSQARSEAKNELCNRYQLDKSKPLIFIFGGSQGSLALNSVINEARSALTNFSIIHGVGRNNDVGAASATYRGIHYIDDMAKHYLAADLIIARSGAVTCAEVDALGKYALFIPLPIGNGEQALNATSLQAQGRAEVVNQKSFTSQWLESNLERLLHMSAARPASGNNSGINAVDRIVDMMERAL